MLLFCLLIDVAPILCEGVGSLFYGVFFWCPSSLGTILLRKWEPVALCCFNCVVAVSVPCLFLALPLVDLQSVIVTFPGITAFLLYQFFTCNLFTVGTLINSIRTASANSMESDLGCTSRIYFDNVTLMLLNVALASKKPFKHNKKCDCSRTNGYKWFFVGFFSIKYRYSEILLKNT